MECVSKLSLYRKTKEKSKHKLLGNSWVERTFKYIIVISFSFSNLHGRSWHFLYDSKSTIPICYRIDHLVHSYFQAAPQNDDKCHSFFRGNSDFFRTTGLSKI